VAARPTSAATKVLSRSGLYLVVLAFSVISMFPFFWTVSSSLKEIWELYQYPPSMLPNSFQWINYKHVVTDYPYARWMWNSTILVVLATSGQVLTAAVVAYSFARFRWPGRDFFFFLTLATMMIPAWVTLIPQYLIFRQLGWLDSIRPLWIPKWFGGGAFYIFLIRQFIMSLPRELDEAAYIDGAGPLRIFVSILLPLSLPALATAAVIAAIANWNDFMGPLVYINSTQKLVLSVGLNYFKTHMGAGETPRDHQLMAACVMASMPPIFLFFVAQRYFVRGVVMSAIKG